MVTKNEMVGYGILAPGDCNEVEFTDTMVPEYSQKRKMR